MEHRMYKSMTMMLDRQDSSIKRISSTIKTRLHIACNENLSGSVSRIRKMVTRYPSSVNDGRTK
ncbi:hypothetical protein X777_04216 [Ooceraea biroi]|uniref:Uncharacterized protein n=1 Tax=Ooceraea biroi TaxID=2015173 RepID=A0A026WI99_OOCBI|nr:hypothetical protein X777_04216 [Ooceraea biroi]